MTAAAVVAAVMAVMTLTGTVDTTEDTIGVAMIVGMIAAIVTTVAMMIAEAMVETTTARPTIVGMIVAMTAVIVMMDMLESGMADAMIVKAPGTRARVAEVHPVPHPVATIVTVTTDRIVTLVHANSRAATLTLLDQMVARRMVALTIISEVGKGSPIPRPPFCPPRTSPRDCCTNLFVQLRKLRLDGGESSSPAASVSIYHFLFFCFCSLL